jgi:putative transposase
MSKEWWTAAELAGLPGVPGTAQNLNARARREGWKCRPRKGRGGGSEYHLSALPSQTQAACLAKLPQSPAPQAGSPADATGDAPSGPGLSGSAFSYDRDALWAHWGRKRQPAKDRALHKMKLLDQTVELARVSGLGLPAAFQAVGAEHGIPWRTIQGWYHGVNGRPGVKLYDRGDWAPALLSGHVGGLAQAQISPEAWDYFRADYLRLERPAASACYERLCRAAADRDWTVPSLRTLERKIQREIPRPVRVKLRQGDQALAKLYPAQQRDRSVFHALEGVNADGHKFDVFVQWPDGDIVRPLMVAWQDLYSGKMLSHRVDKTENADSVRLSLGDLIERYGLPDDAYLDNGRGFASKWITGGTPNRYRFRVLPEEPAGVLTLMGTRVHWTTPYHGQAKPIERGFRDFCEYVARHPALSGAYTGNNADAKPENYGSKAVPLADFLAVLDAEVKAHNARLGRRSEVCRGRSFDQVFAESYERALIRRPTAEQRRLCLLAADRVLADRQSGAVTLQLDRRNRYWCEDMVAYAGHHLVVRFDPQALHQPVAVYTLDGLHIADAPITEAAGFNDSDAAREHGRARRRYVRAVKDQAAAEQRMSALEAAALLPGAPDPDPIHPQVTRLYHPAMSRSAALALEPAEDPELEANLRASIHQLRLQREKEDEERL